MKKRGVNAEQLMNFCRANGVTERGLEIVEAVINNPPARRVRSSSMSSNITCRFPSKKMGVVIQAESRSLEWASIYLKEFDSLVLGYWDQPFYRPSLHYKSGSRTVRVNVTLDFFVISQGFIGFEECKPVEQLVKLAQKSPGRYVFNQELGQYEIPPLEAYLKGTGFGHRVVSDRDVNITYVENLAFLYGWLDEPAAASIRQLWSVAKHLLEVKAGLTIVELENAIEGLERQHVLTAIAQEVFYVDLNIQCLTEPERVMVYANAYDAQKDIVVSESVDIDESHLRGSAADVEEALRRFKIIEPLVNGIADKKLVAAQKQVSIRTLGRWLKAYGKGGLNDLQPGHVKKGNRGSKLPKLVECCINEIIKEYYLDNQARTRCHVYQLLCSQCDELGQVPPSRQAFYSRLDALLDKGVLKVREGAKRAYQAAGFEGAESNGGHHAFRSVSRFLERCHIDHTQADIQLNSLEGAHLGKPWLTTIIDEYSGFVLAVYLSFRCSGVPALMSVLRLMVKRYGVFPEAVVVDGGKEFESIYFETLMARYGCIIISRKGKPRSGGTVERNFGTTNTVFLDNLAGNNKLAKNIRQMSASHNPKDLSAWEAVDFYHALLVYVDEWNDKSSKSGGLSPLQIKNKSIERFGLSEKRRVKFDQDFLRDVLPAPKRPTAHLKRGNKIQVNRVPYWHGCLRSIPKGGVTCDLRYDPFDLNYVYVYYRGEWLKFKATHQQHRQLDDLDAAIVAEVTRQSLVVNERSKSVGRKAIAVKVESLNQEAIEREKERQNECSERQSLCEIDPLEKVRDEGSDDIWLMSIPSSEEVD